jgi:hypothetical protein
MLTVHRNIDIHNVAQGDPNLAFLGFIRTLKHVKDYTKIDDEDDYRKSFYIIGPNPAMKGMNRIQVIEHSNPLRKSHTFFYSIEKKYNAKSIRFKKRSPNLLQIS